MTLQLAIDKALEYAWKRNFEKITHIMENEIFPKVEGREDLPYHQGIEFARDMLRYEDIWWDSVILGLERARDRIGTFPGVDKAIAAAQNRDLQETERVIEYDILRVTRQHMGYEYRDLVKEARNCVFMMKAGLEDDLWDEVIRYLAEAKARWLA